ncbi:FKBP-type peptidyl-prolyl cis-trans isomerase [Kitasatospora sp. NPDC002227]|uniref:FKBP-type peptidyl-prolyl cis-trans isomerase n=1 Tax=Kitasatospora sp. NPDC002227 TaxID=3154773 RepID=UPI00331A58D7
MRRLAGLLAVLPLVLLAACSSGSSSSAGASPSGTSSASAPAVPTPVASASPMPTVAGDFGTKAAITVPSGQPSGQFVVHTVSEGDGPAVAKGDWVTVNYTAKDWTTGKDVSSSYDSGQKPQLYQASGGELVAAFDQSVLGKKVGSRLLVVAPPAAAFGGQGNSSLGVGATDTVVFVLDLMEGVPQDSSVTGAMTQPPATSPQVKDNGKAAPTITVPAGPPAPPADLQKYVLVRGDGKPVTAGQQLIVQYTGVLWANGQQFDSSWSHGGAQRMQIGAGQLIKGWDEGLVGQSVGSRVELVVPPALGYGDKAQSAVPANSTLVFVIDILEAV